MNAPENFELFNLPEGKKKQLLRDPRIRYAGYRKPHPLENKIEIKIQTNGEITSYNALKEALKSLLDDIDLSSKRFSEEVKKFKPDRLSKNY